MQLFIDGQCIAAETGKSILELVKQLGLDSLDLSSRPLAAKIAGEVFTLNYIPVREKDTSAEQELTRRAMAASGGDIRLLRYADASGKDVYVRSMLYVVLLASLFSLQSVACARILLQKSAVQSETASIFLLITGKTSIFHA